MPGASFKLSDPMDSISRSVIEKTDIFLFFLSKKYLNTIGNKALNAIRNNIDIEETGKRPKFIVVRIEATLDAKGFERIETIDLSEKSDDDLKFLLEERLITESKSDGDADLESIQEQPGFQAHWLFKSLIGHHLRNCPAQRLLMVVDGLDFIFEKVPSFEWADGFVRWLGELRNRMNEMPYDRIKLFVNFGLMSYNSMFSKPLHTQALVIRSQPFSNEEISTLLRLYRLTENPSDTATRLLHLFNGQPYLTHFAIERMAETGDGIELFTEIPFGSVREFQAYWKRLKTALSLAVRKRKRDLDILLAGFSDQNETDQKQAPLLIKYRQYLEFLGIAKMSMNQGEIVSQPSCEFYKEMLANERRRTDD